MKSYLSAIAIAVLISVIIILCQRGEPSKIAKYELEFYVSLLEAMQKDDYIFIEDIVPVDWDIMKVFAAYATKENKLEYAGYKYDDDLEDITHEDVMSYIFLKGNKVVYYVDALVPRKMKEKMIDETEYEISLREGGTLKVLLEDKSLLEDWIYMSEISYAYRENRPYFEVAKRDSGRWVLTLKNSIDYLNRN